MKEKRVSFVLVNKPYKSEHDIRLYFKIYKGQRLLYHTRMDCDATVWDKGRQRVSDSYLDDIKYEKINEALDELEKLVLSTYRHHRRNKTLYMLSVDKLRQILNAYLDGDKNAIHDNEDESNVIDFYKKYVSDRQKTPRLKEATKLQEIASYRKFKSFHDTFARPVLLSELSIYLYEGYRDFLYQDPKDIVDSTIHKHIKRFREAMRRAQVEGKSNFNSAAILISSHLYVSQKARESIALDEHQLSRLLYADYTNRPGWRESADLFVAACFTGLRHNRWGDINKANLVQNGSSKYLQVFTNKGARKKVLIPVHPILDEIANRYDWDLPKPLSNQVFNRKLSKIAEYAGLTDIVQRTKRRRGIDEIEEVPLYSIIRTHTARRTFITLAAKAGMSQEDIMSISGHGSTEMVAHYTKEGATDKVKRLQDHPFYNLQLRQIPDNA